MIRFVICSVALLFPFFASHAQDITVSMTGKTTFAPNEELLSDNVITVKNEGVVATTAFITTVYISTDNQWQATDKLITSFSAPALAAGASKISPSYNGASIRATPGSYFLIIRADYDNYVTETDETNNLFITPITVTSPQIDFVFNSYSLSKTSFTQNEKITFAYSVSNTSTIIAGGYLKVGLYLSTDGIWSADDKSISSDGKYLEGANGTSRKTTDNSFFFIPNSAPGNYYLIAKIDPDNNFNEVNKINNTSALAIIVQAANVDLTIDSFYQLSTSSDIGVVAVVTNRGTTPAGPIKIEGFINYYPLFSSYADGYIMPGETKSLYLNFSYNGLPDYYQLKLTVNADQSIAEINYANNSYTGSVLINPPPVESLTVQNMSFAGAYDNTDKEFILNLSIENTGQTYNFYPTLTVEIRNTANVLVHSQDVSPNFSLYPRSSKEQPIALTLNTPLPPGQYQMLLKCKTGYSCVTTFDVSTITLNIQQIQYTLTGTIKGEDGIPITKGNLFLYQRTDDGTVKFIQKITPITSSSFSFQVDEHKHTLYFIPDRQAYPDYVPTVYGKTLTLENESLFELTQNTNLQFEIIKIQPLSAQGDGVISGTVTNEAGATAGRVSSLSAGSPVANAPVILLSSTGVVNGLTYTDQNGYYEFKNLPRVSFQLLVSHELNVAGMEEPYPVSISAKNAEINFTAGTSEVTIQEQVLLFDQTISFLTIPALRYGTSPVTLSAQSSSALPISYSVSDPAVAVISNDQLIIKGVGSLTVSALQSGNDFYREALKSQTFVVGKGEQQINFKPLAAKTYGDDSFTIDATTAASLPVSLTSSDPSIVSIKDHVVTIISAGKVTLSAIQPGNDLYEAATISQDLIINKAIQYINFAIIPEQQYTLGNLELNLSVSSGLKASLTSSNSEIVTIEDDKAVALKPGQVTITALQVGDNNYLPADPASVTLVINQVTGIEEPLPAVTLYPNPSSGFLFIDSTDRLENIEIIDMLGRSMTGWKLSANRIDIENLSSGSYLLKFTSLNKVHAMRIAKK